MAKRKKCDKLPLELQAELTARLKGSAFADYRGLSEWLQSKGHDIGHGAIWNWAQEQQAIEQEMAQSIQITTQLSKMLVAENKDEGGALMEVSERLIGDGLLRLQLLLRRIEREGLIEDEVEMAAMLGKLLPSIGKAIADINRSGIARSKWQAEIKAKLDKLEQEATAGGGNPRKLDLDTLHAIRREVYGLG